MFGMTSEEFWENDPQLYWSYRIFYLKQQEMKQKENIELMKYDTWLKGNFNHIATSIALNNAFSKQHKNYPKYDEVFEKEQEKKKLNKNEINKKVQDEWNAWARY